MPRGDRTGPQGQGPMTGRAAGYCAGYDVPGFMNPVSGQGRGGRRGGGRGRRNGFCGTGQPATLGLPPYGVPEAFGPPNVGPAAAPAGAEEQLNALKGQAEYFEDALDGIKKRITELEAKSEK